MRQSRYVPSLAKESGAEFVCMCVRFALAKLARQFRAAGGEIEFYTILYKILHRLSHGMLIIELLVSLSLVAHSSHWQKGLARRMSAPKRGERKRERGSSLDFSLSLAQTIAAVSSSSLA